MAPNTSRPRSSIVRSAAIRTAERQNVLLSLLLSLNLPAFLLHTILERVDARYRAIRRKLSVRRTFFTDLDALLRYLLFSSWKDGLVDFMYTGLELDTG